MEYKDWNQALQNPHSPRSAVKIEKQGRQVCVKMSSIADENQYRRVLRELEPVLNGGSISADVTVLICRKTDITLSMAALLSTVKNALEVSGGHLKIAWQGDRAPENASLRSMHPRRLSVPRRRSR